VRYGAAKIIALEQRHGESAGRCDSRQARTVNAAADDENIELPIERIEVTLHTHHLRQKAIR
jgi:hypothetical protein